MLYEGAPLILDSRRLKYQATVTSWGVKGGWRGPNALRLWTLLKEYMAMVSGPVGAVGCYFKKN
ncbi:MAG: hypothetical protein DRJ97_00670 [Thermoprotei archaeon]|nr:MAG: hypothetical protein DRJ97_00670 [Thermoprotei archaeon]